MTPFPVFFFSPRTLDIHGACLLPLRISDITSHLGRKPDDGEQISAKVWWALPSTSFLDRIWSLRLDSVNGNQAAGQLCLFAARQVLPIFEAVCPENKHAHVALEALTAFLADPTKDHLCQVNAIQSLLDRQKYYVQSAEAAACAIYFACVLASKIQNKDGHSAYTNTIRDAIDYAAYAIRLFAKSNFQGNEEGEQKAGETAERDYRSAVSTYLDSLYSES